MRPGTRAGDAECERERERDRDADGDGDRDGVAVPCADAAPAARLRLRAPAPSCDIARARRRGRPARPLCSAASSRAPPVIREHIPLAILLIPHLATAGTSSGDSGRSGGGSRRAPRAWLALTLFAQVHHMSLRLRMHLRLRVRVRVRVRVCL
jgi:hypothetical protein